MPVQECADRGAEGQANYSVGRSLVLLSQPEKAIPYLKNYVRGAQSCAVAFMCCVPAADSALCTPVALFVPCVDAFGARPLCGGP